MQTAQKFVCHALISTAILGMAASAQATCWDQASNAYGIPTSVLKAVAKTESGFNPKALHQNEKGLGYDIGLMQINSAWLPTLAKYGIDEHALNDACTNLSVGAWILANNARRLGWSWDAIGAYNVGCAKLTAKECDRRRAQYAWKIHTALKQVAKLDEAALAMQIAAYGDEANQISAVLSRPSYGNQQKKIMVIQLAKADGQGVDGATRASSTETDIEGARDDQ